MENFNWVALWASGAMSVLAALVTWRVTLTHARLDEKRRMKRELLTQLVSHRYDLRGDAFSAALNGTAVVFSDSPSVRQALLEYHAAVT